jgi:hypothetical protein
MAFGRGYSLTQLRGSIRNNLLEAIMKNSTGTKKELAPKQREELLTALKARFEKNMNRHKGLEWAKVQEKLQANTQKL